MLAIIDYQMGNLRSVQKGFERVGVSATIINQPDLIRTADRIVLPGVGAFGDAMAELRRRELIEPIREHILAGKPFLGICLGLQMLFDVGHEGGQFAGDTQEGLGIIPGEVRRFELPTEYKVPHMGWNGLAIRRRCPVLRDIPDGERFYFVHSYYVAPRDAGVIATETDYGGNFCSSIWHENIFATQFHPEKSQSRGLELLKNFAAW
ncbi:MAG: imidazole glycerol phosphate synthase subunit HisH [Pirellulales bacterium]|nr:imidazole glycerol phosphate synthase subunit HisH [Pirellulales bacterium]